MISGVGAKGMSRSSASFVYSRKHLPGPSRPARPALCFACCCEMAPTTSRSTPDE